MKNQFIKSKISLSIGGKDAFLFDNEKNKKIKLSIKKLNHVTSIKGDVLKHSFVIKSVSEYHVSVKVSAIRKSETSSRKIYIDNKKVGVLERDLEFIQTLNTLAGIPTVLKINDYRIVYFHPVVRKIDLYEHGKLIGHTKKNKNMFDFYIQNEDVLPLFIAICIATINSCFL